MTAPVPSTPIHSTSPESVPQNQLRLPVWVRPTVSPEHGVYVVLLVSLLTGTAAAQHWTGATTLAMICAFCGFQAEHPLVVQIRQRKSFKPRFFLWSILYGGIAAAIAVYLYWQNLHWQNLHWQTKELFSPLLGIYTAAIGALMFDGVSVLHREQKSILNEIITFAAVCLAAPFAYTVTTGSLSQQAIGLWLLNTLFFSSSIFTVKLRKQKHDRVTAIQQLILYHLIAVSIVTSLYTVGMLSLVTALTFSIVLIKVGGILWQRQWYCTTRIQHVAILETFSALLFCLLAALSVLPAYLT